MSKFLSRLVTFLMPIVVYCGGVFTVNYFIYSKQEVALTGVHTLIVGDSHTLTSINPQFLKNARNISQSAEPYVVTYWKLEKILETSSPRTIIVGFAPHNIAEFNDLKFSEGKWSNEMFERYYPITDLESIDNKIPVDYFTYYKTLVQQVAFYPKTDHINYLGKYFKQTSNNLSDWKTPIQRHYYWRGEKLGISETCEEYLQAIITLCDNRNIRVVLSSSPVHDLYLDHIPIEIMKRHHYLGKLFMDNVLIFDKTADSSYPDSLFLNSDHLNHAGAERFTKELSEFIEMRKGEKTY